MCKRVLCTNSTRTCKTKILILRGPLQFLFCKNNGRENSRSFAKVVLSVSGSGTWPSFEVNHFFLPFLHVLVFALFFLSFLFPFFLENTSPALTRWGDSSSLLCAPFPISPHVMAQTVLCFVPWAIWFMSVQCQLWAINMWHCSSVCGLMVTS